ncbi:MAG: ABC transporter substrate-binding protein [Gammaproteobacteria bacterium]
MTMALTACGNASWNNPYPASESGKNILYAAFNERPKHLDPAQSYSANEYEFIGEIYEPVLQYSYLKRPYQLEPLTATAIPHPVYYAADGKVLPQDAPLGKIAYSLYTIHIKHGIMYQPHPAFARDAQGHFLYHHLTEAQLSNIHTLSDFAHTGTRELTAADYVYEIKRLASPRLHSPIFGLMSEYIVGLADYARTLQRAYRQLGGGEGHPVYLDLTKYPLSGVKLLGRYTYQIKVRGKYPQLLYWLAMPFFAPVPKEADEFYSQAGLQDRNITLDWFPVGTGAYMMTENNPNRRIVLRRNPNFHDEFYPSEGAPGDAARGLLADAGKKLPFIDEAVYSLEKEDLPYWNKFLQGYYDFSGISSDNFDKAITFTQSGSAGLTRDMKKRHIHLLTAVQPSTAYLGFNMLDPVVGGYSEKQCKLRQAISIAINYEQYIAIFNNGRGIPAYSPIPPGIFGYRKGEAGINPYVYNWRDGHAVRKSIAYARKLLAEAGYPNGIDQKTGQPLLINFDTPASGSGSKPWFDWLRKQFAKINVQLNIRDTNYNRFQDKMSKGNAQMFNWGWNADYPDPENFLFLLYGPNSEVSSQGENSANYSNPKFDRLFVQMKNMNDTPQRQAIINKMLKIAQHDAPWVWGYHPVSYTLFHQWLKNVKPNAMAQNTLKYQRVNPQERQLYRHKWNKPILWPVWLLLVILFISLVPAVITYRRKEHQAMAKRAGGR